MPNRSELADGDIDAIDSAGRKAGREECAKTYVRSVLAAATALAVIVGACRYIGIGPNTLS